MDRKLTRAFASGLLISALILLGYQQLSGNNNINQTTKAEVIELSKKEFEQMQNTSEEWRNKYNKLLTEKETLSKNNNKENSQSKKDANETIEYHLIIKEGTTSKYISNTLAEAGIIDDAEEFDAFLGERQLQRYIQIGEYVVNSEMDYEKISAIITKNAKSR